MSKYLKDGYVDVNDVDYRLPTRELHDVPQGFSPYIIRGKTWYQCDVISPNGNIRCTIHISQENWKRCNEQMRQEVIHHHHQFPDMDRYYRLPIPHHDAENVVQRRPLTTLNKKIVVVIATNNLPLTIAQDLSFKDLLMECVAIGQQNPGVDPRTLIKIDSRPTLTKALVELGSELTYAAIAKYKEYQYVGLCFDAGKVGKFSYLVAYLVNANIAEGPRLLRTIKHFAGTLESYENGVSQVMNECQRLGLIPVGFIGDNLRVQFSAFNTFAERFNIIAMPCGCHTLNLALTDLRKENDIFEHLCAVVEIMAHLFNKKPIKAFFYLSMPLPIETRWVILFDVALWIVQHTEDILGFLDHSEIPNIKAIHKYLPLILEVVFDAAPKLVQLLLPIKLLMNVFEKDKTSIVDMYPYTQVALLTLARLVEGQPSLIPLAEHLTTIVKRRLLNCKAGKIQYSLFLLTVQGIKIKRAVNNHQDLLVNQILTEFYPLVYVSFQKTLDTCKQLIVSHSFKGTSMADKETSLKTALGDKYPSNSAQVPDISGDEDFVGNEENNDEEPVEISYARPVPQNTLDNDPGLRELNNIVEEIHDVNYPEAELITDIYEQQVANSLIAKNTFLDIAELFGFQRAEISALYTDIFEDTDILQEIEVNPSNKGFWSLLLDTKYAPIAKFMKIISVLVTSEAVCERIFSQMRLYLTAERSNTGTMLMEGRNSFMDSSIHDIYKRLGIPRRF